MELEKLYAEYGKVCIDLQVVQQRKQQIEQLINKGLNDTKEQNGEDPDTSDKQQ